ncbi:cobalamin biosynthesis protein, partial [Streptomyces sp. NRRL S-15]|uniref:cobalamin biosynthesis protein n=1 Tax=Streptomyces sp. NRRL S-15 TaxID=1463886 RepID=UPI001900F043
MTRAELVVGVGARRGAPAEEVLGLIRRTLEEAGWAAGDVVELVTLDTRADEPGITGAAARLGVPLRSYTAGELAGVTVPHPSTAPREAVGTGSVAEAAALMEGGELLVPKRKSASATCAVARRWPSGVTSASTNGVEPFTMAAMLPPTKHIESAGPDLRHHGDAEVRGLDLTDLAVNVRTGTPPDLSLIH